VQQKTITVVIDEAGNSSVDLDGFAGQGCEKVLKDFQGDDRAKVRRKKPVFYSQTSDAQSRQLKSGR
jgi:hypothetical protein